MRIHALVLTTLLAAACGIATPPGPPETVAPVPMGNGHVYYFHAHGEQYMRSLDVFLDKNPGLFCTGVGQDGHADDVVMGYYVACYEMPAPAQSETVP